MMAIPMHGYKGLWDFIMLRRPPASKGHLEKVQQEADRASSAAKKTSDVIREFIHDINAEQQREIARRGE